jgi:hypothetical protein
MTGYWIVPIVLVAVCIYAFYSHKATKSYFEDATGEKAEKDLQLQKIIKGMVQEFDPNLQNKIMVNGHYSKRVELGIKITTYYSYALVLDPKSNKIDVYSYHPETKKMSAHGSFPKDCVEAIDVHSGVHTNYIFKDEKGKQLFAVNTKAEDYAADGEYSINFSQLEEYNQFRSYFGLDTEMTAQKGDSN